LLLHQKLLNFFLEKKKKNGSFSSKSFLTLETSAGSPAGAGLGGSSSLGVSLIGALATWARSSAIDTITEGEALTDIIRDIETTVISVPAGLQDYYGAMFGGLQALRWAPARHDRKWLDRSILPELQERLLLFYSGQSRNSGINNWELFKSFIDQKDQVRERFQKISDSANLLESALKNRDWTKVGLAIQSEWNIRKTLAPGISTPLMEEAFNLATQNGATAMKVCGAGGGGCFFAYLPDLNSEKRSAIVKAVESLGVKSLPFNFVGNGLSIQN
jgi:D-glycero-alpha-D-manno-heptose-7-phosphate kinase